jgi:hypothetical protein
MGRRQDEKCSLSGGRKGLGRAEPARVIRSIEGSGAVWIFWPLTPLDKVAYWDHVKENSAEAKDEEQADSMPEAPAQRGFQPGSLPGRARDD